MPYAKIALLAYHIESSKPFESQRLSPSHVLIRKNGLGHLWSTRLCSQDTDKSLSMRTQTRSVFTNLIHQSFCWRVEICTITAYVPGSLCAASILSTRTWSTNAGHCSAQQGLNGDTHFIASTGIEGTGTHRHDLVVMDAYSILGLEPEQISYLNDFNMLCAAKDYNVTFERGTRICYADRAHYFISGTASIDNQGNTLYPGNSLNN